jgi:hypothetical protein
MLNFDTAQEIGHLAILLKSTMCFYISLRFLLRYTEEKEGWECAKLSGELKDDNYLYTSLL